MRDARLFGEWDRVAMIVAKIHNVNCAERSEQIRDFTFFNPFRAQPKPIKLSLKELRAVHEGRRSSK